MSVYEEAWKSFLVEKEMNALPEWARQAGYGNAGKLIDQRDVMGVSPVELAKELEEEAEKYV